MYDHFFVKQKEKKGHFQSYVSLLVLCASFGTSVKDESLGLVSVSRLKVPRLSVSSRSRTKFWNWSRLGLVSDEKF